jgi:transcription elongation GreA/GreB family factor
MSSAFTKEQDDDELREELPDRSISPHRNLVTPEGFAQIEAELARLHVELDAAQAKDDKRAVARAARDLRYWTARRASAEIVRPIADHEQARFGHRIVIEDEADPAKGLIPYVAPLAKALLGKSVGDGVEAIHHSARIIEIG